MLYEYMGSDVFMTGIQDYLLKYEFSNADTDDLWESLSGVDTTVNITDMMNTWVLQGGFPIIFVYLKSMNDENVTFLLEQQRMMKYGPSFWNNSISNLLILHFF